MQALDLFGNGNEGSFVLRVSRLKTKTKGRFTTPQSLIIARGYPVGVAVRDALGDLEGVIHVTAYRLDGFAVFGDSFVRGEAGRVGHVVLLGGMWKPRLLYLSNLFVLSPRGCPPVARRHTR